MFTVDLDELLGTVDELARCGRALDVLLEDLSARVVLLQHTWTGAAADAQVAAQAEWEDGFRAMTESLGVMRTVAAAAHSGYERAATTNLRMWVQVR